MESFHTILNEMQPSIIVGMHRSGTSLLSRLFTDLGIHMGDWLSRDAESVFFQKINRSIYSRTKSHWAEPERLLTAMESEEFVSREVSRVRRRLIGRRVRFGFPPLIEKNFGRELWNEMIEPPEPAWGWKDPRTALVIPIWNRVFPAARWIHIIRDGVDVAISLYSRALRQQKKLLLKFYRFDFSERTLHFDYCFHLWEEYLSVMHRALSEVDSHRLLEIRYEDLLREPAEELKKILAFVEFPATAQEIDRVAERVDSGRLDNSKAIATYQELINALPESRWINTLGYAYREG